MPTKIESQRLDPDGWRDHGEGLYMLYGDAAIERTADAIKFRYPDDWQDKVEALEAGARDAGRDGKTVP